MQTISSTRGRNSLDTRGQLFLLLGTRSQSRLVLWVRLNSASQPDLLYSMLAEHACLLGVLRGPPGPVPQALSAHQPGWMELV